MGVAGKEPFYCQGLGTLEIFTDDYAFTALEIIFGLENSPKRAWLAYFVTIGAIIPMPGHPGSYSVSSNVNSLLSGNPVGAGFIGEYALLCAAEMEKNMTICAHPMLGNQSS
jgi:hypothetical protein